MSKCSMRLPEGNALWSHQARYAESIRYINPVSGDNCSTNSLRVARALKAEAPILKKGNIVVVLPPSDVLKDTVPMGEKLPFWLGMVEENEQAPIDHYGRRVNLVKKDDDFVINWMNVLNTRNGRVTNSVVGKWQQR
eukprot:2544026-Pleurochrysis_carterae.AAC.1